MYAGIATPASTMLIRLWADNNPEAVRAVVASFDQRDDRYESEASAAERAGVPRITMRERRDAFAAALSLACRAAGWTHDDGPDPSPVFCNLDDDTYESPADAEPRIAAVIAAPAFGAAATVMATAARGSGDPVSAAAVLLRSADAADRPPIRAVAEQTGLDAGTVSRITRRTQKRIVDACEAGRVDPDVVLAAVRAAGEGAAARCLALADEAHWLREHDKLTPTDPDPWA